jgi:hypothetical protein
MSISYFATKLSPNISQKPMSGFLICQNVPICRSGFQEYAGKELIKHEDYDPAWKLDDDTIYKVYRPREEVTDPKTVASFEGAPVVDDHPPRYIVPGSLLNLDNATEFARGHIERVHVGDDTDDGEATVAGDMHIISRELADKVIVENKRDVSCGYTYRLRMVDGRLEMYEIRGNHTAVVDKGRAGHEVAIMDSAPARIETDKEKHRMTLKERMERIRAEGWKSFFAKDPDAAAAAVAAMDAELENKGKEAVPEDEAAKKKAAEDKAAKDAKDAADKAAKDAVGDAHRMAAHDALDRLLDCRGASDRMGKDAFGEPANLEALQKELDKFIKEEEQEPQHQNDAAPELESLDSAETEEEKKAREKKEAEDKAAKDAEEAKAKTAQDGAVIEPEKIDEKGKAAVKATMDSALALANRLKPAAAAAIAKPKSKRTAADNAMVDSYNDAARIYKHAKSLTSVAVAPAAVDVNPYAAFATVVVPKGVAADSATHQTKDEPDFFNGVPFSVGNARRNDWLAKQQEKK